MSGTISFNYFPGSANWRVPGIYVETNPNNTATSGQIGNVLIVGQSGGSGTAANNVAVLAVNLANVEALAGSQSMLTNMYKAYIAVDPLATVYIAPVSVGMGELTAGVQTITITGPATGNGVLALYVCGKPIPVSVTTGQTATQIATNISIALNQTTLPISCAASAGVVTVTASNGGIAAGDVPIAVNYYGAVNNEYLPAGVTVTIATTTAPAGSPTLSTTLANIESITFDVIVNPYTDTENLGLITSFLSEAVGRWNPTVLQFGQSFSAVRDSVSALVTFGNALNDPFQNFLGFSGSNSPAWAWTAAYAAACAASIRVNPALPLSGIALAGILPPPKGSAFAKADQNTLLFSGISTFNVQGGQVILSRSVTSYQTNTFGTPDTSWLDTETPATLTAVNRAFINGLASQFQRKILVDNGTQLSYANNFVTPATILAAAIGIYSTLASLGLVQDVAYFAQNAQAVNAGGGQVSLYLPVNIANQLRQIAINVSFSKS